MNTGEFMEIPSQDLVRHHLHIRAELVRAIQAVLDKGSFILGEEVQAFEQEFAAFCGAPHAIGTSSGTSALQVALLAAGIAPGDEVITVSHTAVPTVAAIEQAGGHPVLVDIDPHRYTLDPDQVIPAITPRTRFILPVHIYGCPADLEPLLEVARQHDLLLVEDCAQAHGAAYHGRPVGTWGQVAAFSFYPTKNLGALGDAGAVLTNDPLLARRACQLRQYGWNTDRLSEIKGMNACLDELQAAVLRVKLKYLEGWNLQRRLLAARYTSELEGAGLVLPVHLPDALQVFHQYVVRTPLRDALREHLRSQGIQTGIHYPVPVHLQPAYAGLGLPVGSLPITEQVASQILSLPIHPEMDEEQVTTICQAVRAFLS